MKHYRISVTVRRGLEKSPVCPPTEIAPRFCLAADFSGINHPAGFQAHAPDKAFHNPAPAAAVIPDWRANPGLCSNRATEVSWLKHPATSPSSSAVSALVGRSNSLGWQSRPATLTRARRKTVFTHTQMAQKCNTFTLAVRRPSS